MDSFYCKKSIIKRDLNFLIIKLKHIGDALLLTSALVAIKENYPNSKIHVLVRSGTEGILQGCPSIDQIHTVAAPAGERSLLSNFDDLKTVLRLRKLHLDFAIDVGEGSRGRIIALTSNAKATHTNNPSFDDPRSSWLLRKFTTISAISPKGIHQVEKDYRVVSSVVPLPENHIPPICFEKELSKPWPIDKPFIIFHPATRWKRKEWPVENWVELGRRLSKKFKIIVSCGPDPKERAIASEIAEKIGLDSRSTQGKLDWPQLAGALYEAKLFVGIDTAAMHLSAACKCPTVAIFGPTRTWAWAPWKTKNIIVAPNDMQWSEAATGGSISEKKANVEHFSRTIIKSITIENVFHACEELLKEK